MMTDSEHTGLIRSAAISGRGKLVAKPGEVMSRPEFQLGECFFFCTRLGLAWSIWHIAKTVVITLQSSFWKVGIDATLHLLH